MWKTFNKKIKKRTEGVISIFLCLIISPFVILASSLVELARYQEQVELQREIIECAGTSTLADYDKYLNDRFALLGLSNEVNISDTFAKYYAENTNISETQAQSYIKSIIGELSLDNNEVLKQQILDYSSTVGMAKFVAEDLNIEELLSKLDKMGGLGDFADKAEKIAKACDALADVVEKVEELENQFKKIKTSIETVETKVNGLGGELQSIYNDAKEVFGLTGDFDINNIGSLITSDNAGKVLALANRIKGLNNSINGIKSEIDNVKSNINDLETKYNDVITALDNANSKIRAIRTSGSSKSTATAASEKVDTVSGNEARQYEKMSEAIKGAVDEAYNGFKRDCKQTIENTMNDLVSDLNDALTIEFSDDATSLTTLISDIKKISNEGVSPQDALSEESIEFIKKICKPLIEELKKPSPNLADISVNAVKNFVKNEITGLKNQVQQIPNRMMEAVKEATKSLKDGINNSLIKQLQDLVSTLKSLTGVNLLANDKLNARVTALSGIDPARDGIDEMLEDIDKAINQLKNSTASGNIVGILRAMASFMNSIKGLFKHLNQTINEKITGLKELATGGITNAYDKFLLIAYATGVFSCRSDFDLKGNLKNGNDTMITGYKYADIPFGGNKSNKMFRGAELEYLLYNSQDEVANQVAAFWDIYFIRLVCDLIPVFIDPDPQVAALAGAASIGAFLVYLIVIMLEPLLDTMVIVNGGDVSFIKTKAYCTATGIGDFIKDIGDGLSDVLKNELKNRISSLDDGSSASLDKSDDTGDKTSKPFVVKYKGYLALNMFFKPENKLLGNTKNLITLEAKQKNGEGFTLKKSYTQLGTDMNPQLSYLFKLYEEYVSSGNFKTSVSY